MPRFFVSPEDIKDGCAVLAGDDAKHISRSLRMRCGEPLTLWTSILGLSKSNTVNTLLYEQSEMDSYLLIIWSTTRR